MNIIYEREDELYHHGIPGMKWYRRRFQNEDGSYTALGKLRYGIGAKARETAKTMSEWSRQHTQGAQGRQTDDSGNYKNVHMLNPSSIGARTRQSPGSTKMETRLSDLDYAARQVKGANDWARGLTGSSAARFIKTGSDGESQKMRIGKPMEHWTNRLPQQGKMSAEERMERAREMTKRAPVMSPSDTRNLYLQGAKNLAGNYARYAKDAIDNSSAVRSARVMGMAGKQIAGMTGHDLMDRAKNAATTADVYGTVLKNGLKARGQEAAEGAKKYAGAMGEIMKAYGKEIGGNANSAALRAGFYMNKAKDAAGSVAKDAAQTGRVIGMAGKQIAGMTGRDLMNLAKRRSTGDPGEDREKLDPNARSVYDRRLANALGWANGRRQAAAQAEADARAKHDEDVRAGVKADIAKYQKQMMDDIKATNKVNSDRASFYLTRSGYGGELPYKLTFGKDTVTSNPLKAAYDYNNERSHLTNVSGRMDEKLSDRMRAQNLTAHRLQFGDDTYKYDPSKSKLKTVYDKKGSDDDRLAAYTEYLKNNSAHSSNSSRSAVNRMAKLEDEMNAFRDNRARANLANKSAVTDMLMRSNPNAQAVGEHTNYFGTNARQRDEINARTKWTIDDDRQKRQDSERQYNEARRYAWGQTSQASRDAGYINRDALSRKLNELYDKEDAEERRTTKIPPWIAEKYGTSKEDIPSYLWDALKKRR